MKQIITLALLYTFCVFNITAVYANPNNENTTYQKYSDFKDAVQNDEYLKNLEYNITKNDIGSVETGSFTSMGQNYSYECITNNVTKTYEINLYQQNNSRSEKILVDEFILNGQTKELVHNGEIITLEYIESGSVAVDDSDSLQAFVSYPQGSPAFEEHTTAVVRDWFYSRVIDVAMIMISYLVTGGTWVTLPLYIALDIAEELIRNAVNNNVSYTSPMYARACQKQWVATFPDDGSYASVRYDFETKYYEGYHYNQIGTTWTDYQRYF